MQTNSINFTATDKMTVWQGVRKLSDAAIAVLYELSANTPANNGVVVALPSFDGSSGAGAYWFVGSKGTALSNTTSAAIYSAPRTAVQTQIASISEDTNTLRINGVQAATSSVDQGTGNYGNYPAYFYARGGTSLYFNGHDYGSIARGAASTAAQITAAENYINKLTKAFT
jgi:hypothetical protein